MPATDRVFLSLYWVVRLWWSQLRTRKFPKFPLGSPHPSRCPVYIHLQFFIGRNGNVSTCISSWILTALFEGSSWSSWFRRFLLCLISSLGHVFARFNPPVVFLRLIGDDLVALWVIDIESRGDKYIRRIKVLGWLLGKGWIADELLTYMLKSLINTWFRVPGGRTAVRSISTDLRKWNDYKKGNVICEV